MLRALLALTALALSAAAQLPQSGAETRTAGRSDLPLNTAGGGFAYTKSGLWAGYMLADLRAPDLHGVSGTFIVPTVDCSNKASAVSYWVGIGGVYHHGQVTPNGSKKWPREPLFQAGVETNCIHGKAETYAWEEAVGKVTPPMTHQKWLRKVIPGDTVSVSIEDHGLIRRWTISVSRNGRQLWARPGHWSSHYTPGHTAECIVESPEVTGAKPVVAPLANFGQVQFRACDAIDQNGASYPMVENQSSLPPNWRLVLWKAQLPRHPVWAAPVVPATSPPAVLWLNPDPKQLPPLGPTTVTAAKLTSLLKKAGLWSALAASDCGQATVEVNGATLRQGDADLVWVDTCSSMWARDFAIRKGKVRAFNDAYDGKAAVWYLPFAVYNNRQPAVFTITRAGLDPGVVEAPTTTTSAPPASSSEPTLGLDWANSGGGYGEVEPTVISNGGDPTGVVTDVTWQSWGGAEATGTGTGSYDPTGVPTSTSIQAPVTIVAFDLGTCGGTHPAYQEVEWYFPTEGQSFDATEAIDACTYDQSGFITRQPSTSSSPTSSSSGQSTSTP